MLKMLLFAVTAAVSVAAAPITRNTIGEMGEFGYELWKNSSKDDAEMTLTGGGTFECYWADNAHALFRMGKKLGSVKTYQEYGNITVDYSAEHNITKGDVSYLCVYGWTEDPLIEFYVVESYGNYKPPGGVGFKGTIEVDGGTYEVYEDTRVDQPSIQGTKTFKQYFSVRTEKRTEGTITVSDHFKAWEALGLDMTGNIYEVTMCIEGYKGAGNAKISRHILTIGDAVYGNDMQLYDEASPKTGSDPFIFFALLGGLLATAVVIISLYKTHRNIDKLLEPVEIVERRETL